MLCSRGIAHRASHRVSRIARAQASRSRATRSGGLDLPLPAAAHKPRGVGTALSPATRGGGAFSPSAKAPAAASTSGVGGQLLSLSPSALAAMSVDDVSACVRVLFGNVFVCDPAVHARVCVGFVMSSVL